MLDRFHQLDPAAIVPEGNEAEAARALLVGVVDHLARAGRPATDFWHVFGIRFMPIIAASDDALLASLLPTSTETTQQAAAATAIDAVRSYLRDLVARPAPSGQNNTSS